VNRADEAQRRRLHERFAELCRIPSPFGHERACAERVSAELRELGLDVLEDGSGPAAGSECGNLLARVPGSGEDWLLLCAHLDTVIPQAPIEPVLDNGLWRNAHEGILGADNKAAVAVILEVARAAVQEGAPVGLELLFTVCEENALRGAKAFDPAELRSRFGYVFDHASPIGEVVVASPTYYRMEAEFGGVAAHAGIRPEEGRSAIAAAAAAVAAMRLGRVDDETTANVGRMEGGSASTNVVPERCRVEAEARSLDDVKAEALVAEMVDRVHDGANAHECDVDVSVERLFHGYRVRPSAPGVTAAEEALRACGYEPRRIATGGGSDANALEAAGFHCVNLANGTERNHQPDERVSVVALEGMLDVALALLGAAARC
jgi:tripeptide aminopeptidase